MFGNDHNPFNLSAIERHHVRVIERAFGTGTDVKEFSHTGWDWLQDLSYSQAFLCCVGSGPWTVNRRATVQRQALDALDGRDLSTIEPKAVENMRWPLEWQRLYTRSAADYCAERSLTFRDLCEQVEDHAFDPDPLSFLYQVCGSSSKRVKVLDLFARDKLKIPAFPIDRHVRRRLVELSLPIDGPQMVRLCQAAGLSPASVNRSIFGSVAADPKHDVPRGA